MKFEVTDFLFANCHRAVCNICPWKMSNNDVYKHNDFVENFLIQNEDLCHPSTHKTRNMCNIFNGSYLKLQPGTTTANNLCNMFRDFA